MLDSKPLLFPTGLPGSERQPLLTLQVNLQGVMCRTPFRVDWRGYLYDRDFNQMPDLSRDGNQGMHIAELTAEDLTGSSIRVGEQSYGCAAGQGSSCGGALG